MKKFQFSKLLPLLTGIIFLVSIYSSFHIDYSSVMDTAVYCTALTISGGIFGTTIVWYLKKSQVENIYKIKMGLYQEVSKQQLTYNEKMYKLKKEYALTDMDTIEIDNSTLEEMKSEELNGLRNYVEDNMNEASQTIELQNF